MGLQFLPNSGICDPIIWFLDKFSIMLFFKQNLHHRLCKSLFRFFLKGLLSFLKKVFLIVNWEMRRRVNSRTSWPCGWALFWRADIDREENQKGRGCCTAPQLGVNFSPPEQKTREGILLNLLNFYLNLLKWFSALIYNNSLQHKLPEWEDYEMSCVPSLTRKITVKED